VPELDLLLETLPAAAALPALPILTDAEQARTLLERSIRAGGPAYQDIRMRSCAPNVVRYKPGSRCTILYGLEYPDGGAAQRNSPDLVVAKTYRGDKGCNAYEGMRALWEALNLLSLVLNCWTKIKPVRLTNTMVMLERHLSASAMS
jgi:hypothetical protein